MYNAREFLASLPALPGVYRMYDAGGGVLYVGKARDLRRRVSSYFRTKGLYPRTRLMMSEVDHIEVTVTRSESEALLLENNLIKAHHPRYNILFRDDKSYPYIVLSRHTHPRLAYWRGTAAASRDRHFGPYPNSQAVRDSITLLQRVFRLRTCEDSVYRNRSRPCLLHQIHRCSGPCVGLVSDEDYGAAVDDAALFLSGRSHELARRLTDQMEAAAARQDYEQAALLRDQVFALRRVQEKQFVEQDRPVDADLVAAVLHRGQPVLNLVMVRGGRHLGDRSLFPDNVGEGSAAEALAAFLSHHYAEGAGPPLVLVNEDVDEAVTAELPQLRVARGDSGPWRGWMVSAVANARLAVDRRLARHEDARIRATALAELLELPALNSIECFDISHHAGDAAGASCVVWADGRMQRGRYRRYRLRDTRPGDDYGAMREVLSRRYRRILDEGAPLPDLLLVDGGAGQLAVAVAVLEDLGLAASLPVVGVAKGEDRRPGLETLHRPGAVEPIRPGPGHVALLLVQEIRDEAHRFAISGNRAAMGRARQRSQLEDLAGVGARRRQNLLTTLGGLRGVREATVEELSRVEGIGPRLAQSIHRQLHEG